MVKNLNFKEYEDLMDDIMSIWFFNIIFRRKKNFINYIVYF